MLRKFEISAWSIKKTLVSDSFFTNVVTLASVLKRGLGYNTQVLTSALFWGNETWFVRLFSTVNQSLVSQ